MARSRFRVTLLTALLLPVAGAASAQSPNPGQWVRVQGLSGVIEGRVQRFDADSVVLQDSAGVTVALARGEVSRLWISSRVARGTGRGLGIGLVAGGGAGALAGAINDEGMTGNGLRGALVGAAAGALVGSFIKHHEWVEAELPRYRAAAPAPGAHPERVPIPDAIAPEGAPAPELQPGHWTRVGFYDTTVDGALVRLDDDSLIVRNEQGRFAFQRSEVNGLWVSRGTAPMTMRGMLGGALGGALVMGVLGFAVADDGWVGDSVAESVLVSAAVGALAGGVIGALLGTGQERHLWKAIALPPSGVHVR